ncbi:hypothetical protein DYB30_007091 [Aphanomyces astaci]|uniref:GPI ethanolamine phosphate transferase 1 n=1 Tax=Aphanomyces astaci TaxID=112090 RepID=A0A397C2Q1_APHAT|nr:hypothetical protein DYB30_007091 [Aphanomyces astaci]
MTATQWPTGLLILGTLFHAIYLLSIFDIYFKSPVVHDIPAVDVMHESYPPPAKRLVIFIADGCRADTFFDATDRYAVFAHSRLREANLTSLIHSQFQDDEPTRAPFLRHVIKHVGSWGVSHTGCSRPGHVAMFAGMYEDVSAVTRGWQENPVDFDSIFNQRFPDIVPMFAKNVEHVHEKHYSSADEDFAKDATVLDTWVYHKVQALLDDAKTNRTLFNQLQANQVVFFLHFLGIDSNGHAHRPHSREYISNVALVDRLGEGIHTMLEAHGSGFAMDVPSHSHDQVFDQLKAHTVPEADALRLWNLTSFVRKDVLQADIAPLAAALLGLPYPRNSVGVLPFSYMEQGLYRARAVVFNAKSLFVHASIRQQLKQNATWSIFFRGFPRLDRCLGQFATIERAFGAKAYGDIEAISQRIIGDALAGLRHFQRRLHWACRQHSTGLAVTPEDIRLALWYLIFFKLSFFATGNIASMSSFEISSTFRFVTVFNPFVMGALLVLKILLPMVIVTCAFHVLLTLKGHHPNRYVFCQIYIYLYICCSRYRRLFLLVVLLSDMLALHFFFLVKDEGSWKEIGNSISIFGIVNLKMVFVPLLLFVAKLLFRQSTATDRSLHLD